MRYTIVVRSLTLDFDITVFIGRDPLGEKFLSRYWGFNDAVLRHRGVMVRGGMRSDGWVLCWAGHVGK